MSFKSYAQAGQFGTYHIDLPIKTEINEDLRAAGNFAKQMERSQQYREKWASTYLSALNDKSNVERQNRDDNFEFLQNNFKRIYEGEQREFEGKLAEMQREQAEAANAGPGFWDDLIPALIKAAPQIAGIVSGMQAQQNAAIQQNSVDVLNANPDLTAAQIGANRRLFESGLVSPTEQTQIIQGLVDNHAPNSSYADVNTMLHLTGENQMHMEITAWRRDVPRFTQKMHSMTQVGSGEPLDPSLPNWQGVVGNQNYTKAVQKATQDLINETYGGERGHYSDNVNFGIVQKEALSVQNSVLNKANNTFERLAQGATEQLEVLRLEAAIHSTDTNLITENWRGRVDREMLRLDTNGLPIPPEQARYNAAVQLQKDVEKSNINADQWIQYRKVLDANKRKDMGFTPRGGPVDGVFDEIGRTVQKRTNDIQTLHTQTTIKQQQKQATEFINQVKSIENPIERQDFINKAREFNWETANPEIGKTLNAYTSHYKKNQEINSPTFEQKHGFTRKSVEEAATEVAIGGLGPTAVNKKLGRKGVSELPSSRVAIQKIAAHMRANMSKYERQYADMYSPGSEELLQQAAHDSYEAMTKAGALPIVNNDGKVDPTKAAEYNFFPSKRGGENATREYIDLTKNDTKTFHEIVKGGDRAQFKKYAETVARVKMNGGPLHTPAMVEQRVMLHNMPAVKARQQAMEELGTPITRDQAVDELLELAGYPDAITDPFTMKDAESNSQILNRIYDQSKTTTNHGYAAGVVGKTNGGNWQPAPHVRRMSFTQGSVGPNIQTEIASWPVEARTNHATQAVIAFQQERARVYGLSPHPVKDKGTFNLAVREFAPGGVTSPYADDDALELHEHMPGTDHGKAGMGTMDIPVANDEQAAFVINHFTKYGFRYLYGDAGHKHHVHLVLPKMRGEIY